MTQKVLILPAWYPSDSSPVNGIFVQDQAQILLRKYDVAVLVPGIVGLREAIKQRSSLPACIEHRAGLPVCRARAINPVPGMRSLRLAYWNFIRAARQGFEWLQKVWGNPDVIHAHVVLPAGWVALNLAKHYSIPVILTEHSSPFQMHLGSAYQRHLVREVLTRVDHVVAVSPTLARQVQEFQESLEISVVGNLIKTEFFSPLENNEKRRELPSGAATRLLSIGMLTEQKGLIYLLEAAQLLIQRGLTSFEIIIGGDGPARPELEQFAQAAGLSNRCRFVGVLTPIEVRTWMQRCDVLVLPSVHETFGIVVGEAMACGKPVIATRCGGPEYVVTPETGMLVEPANPAALAEALTDFIFGRHRYDSFSIRQSIIDRFGEEAFLRNISEVYDQVWAKR